MSRGKTERTSSKETARRERARQLFKRMMKRLADAPFMVPSTTADTGVTRCIDEIVAELEKEARLARVN